MNRPLKWDTLRLWTPSTFKDTGRQSWTFKKTSLLVLKRRFFSNVQLWRPVSLNPVGVQRRTVSHFKGLFKTFKMRYSTFLYFYWIGLHVYFKKAILHLKMASVRRLMSMSVYLCISKTIILLCWNFQAHSETNSFEVNIEKIKLQEKNISNDKQDLVL